MSDLMKVFFPLLMVAGIWVSYGLIINGGMWAFKVLNEGSHSGWKTILAWVIAIPVGIITVVLVCLIVISMLGSGEPGKE